AQGAVLGGAVAARELIAQSGAACGDSGGASQIGQRQSVELRDAFAEGSEVAADLEPEHRAAGSPWSSACPPAMLREWPSYQPRRDPPDRRPQCRRMRRRPLPLR